jgi:hypothetical protein
MDVYSKPSNDIARTRIGEDLHLGVAPRTSSVSIAPLSSGGSSQRTTRRRFRAVLIHERNPFVCATNHMLVTIFASRCEVLVGAGYGSRELALSYIQSSLLSPVKQVGNRHQCLTKKEYRLCSSWQPGRLRSRAQRAFSARTDNCRRA